jgi:D-serine deaminase-like pyridoxal phosphate-dependent protein
LHVYDGHIRDSDLNQRIAHAEADFAAVEQLVDRLESAGLPVPEIVVGGTPTFPVHARHARRTCSPGTCLFWDVSYATKFPDLDFQWAAVLLARVISKPGPGRLCFDLGYKSVSPDNPDLRVELLDVPEARVINHSEEHLAVETPAAGRFAVGDVVYGIPFHVCPTVALHREAVVCREGRAVERWQVAARDRRITY